MRFFGHALALFLMAAATAPGTGMPLWRDWSKPVLFVGGNPFEQVRAVDEELRLQRRADPILEQIGESTLSRHLGAAMQNGVRAPAALFHAATMPDQDADETPSRKKGKDLDRLMRDLGLASAGQDGSKGSIASLVLGDGDDDGKSSKWGWLADEVRGSGEDAAADGESLEEAAEANGRLLDDVESYLDATPDTATARTADRTSPADRTRDRATPEKRSGTGDGGAGRLDSGLAANAGSPSERRAANDLAARRPDAAPAASAPAGATTDASAAAKAADSEAPRSFTPDWDSLLAGGKTVNWRQSVGLAEKGPADFAHGAAGPSATAPAASPWSPSAAGISAPAALRPGGPATATADLGGSPSWGRIDGPSAASAGGRTAFGTGGIQDAGGWSVPKAAFGGSAGAGLFGTGGGASAGIAMPSYTGAGGSSGGYRLPDAGKAGVQLRDTTKGLAGGGMKPAWY